MCTHLSATAAARHVHLSVSHRCRTACAPSPVSHRCPCGMCARLLPDAPGCSAIAYLLLAAGYDSCCARVRMVLCLASALCSPVLRLAVLAPCGARAAAVFEARASASPARSPDVQVCPALSGYGGVKRCSTTDAVARVTVLSPRARTTVSHSALYISTLSILHYSHASFVRSTPHTPWGRELQSLRWTQARHVLLTNCLPA